jgi:hypothetical protein
MSWLLALPLLIWLVELLIATNFMIRARDSRSRLTRTTPRRARFRPDCATPGTGSADASNRPGWGSGWVDGLTIGLGMLEATEPVSVLPDGGCQAAPCRARTR